MYIFHTSHNLLYQDFPNVCHTFSEPRIFPNVGHTSNSLPHQHFSNVHYTLSGPRVFPNVCHTSYIHPDLYFHNVCHTLSETRIFPNVYHTSHNFLHQYFPNVCHTLSLSNFSIFQLSWTNFSQSIKIMTDCGITHCSKSSGMCFTNFPFLAIFSFKTQWYRDPFFVKWTQAA